MVRLQICIAGIFLCTSFSLSSSAGPLFRDISQDINRDITKEELEIRHLSLNSSIRDLNNQTKLLNEQSNTQKELKSLIRSEGLKPVICDISLGTYSKKCKKIETTKVKLKNNKSSIKSLIKHIENEKKVIEINREIYHADYVSQLSTQQIKTNVNTFGLDNFIQRVKIKTAQDQRNISLTFKEVTLPKQVIIEVLREDKVIETFEGSRLVWKNGLTDEIDRYDEEQDLLLPVYVRLIDNRKPRGEDIALSSLLISEVDLTILGDIIQNAQRVENTSPLSKSKNQSEIIFDSSISNQSEKCINSEERRETVKNSFTGKISIHNLEKAVLQFDGAGTVFRLDNNVGASAGHNFRHWKKYWEDNFDKDTSMEQVLKLYKITFVPHNNPKKETDNLEFFIDYNSIKCSECWRDIPTGEGHKLGNDWALFKLHPNTKQIFDKTGRKINAPSYGKTANEIYKNTPPMKVDTANLNLNLNSGSWFIAGFGKRGGPKSYGMQIATGAVIKEEPDLHGNIEIHYKIETARGTSGGPIFYIPDPNLNPRNVRKIISKARVVGIHNQAKCGATYEDAYNAGTSFRSPELKIALEGFMPEVASVSADLAEPPANESAIFTSLNPE